MEQGLGDRDSVALLFPFLPHVSQGSLKDPRSKEPVWCGSATTILLSARNVKENACMTRAGLL